MELALLMIFLLSIPTAIWLGISMWRDRHVRHRDHPPATDGGPPTIYRRAPPPDEADLPTA